MKKRTGMDRTRTVGYPGIMHQMVKTSKLCVQLVFWTCVHTHQLPRALPQGCFASH